MYAIEPSSVTAAALRSNVFRNGLGNVTVLEAAAGREDGSARLDPIDGEASQSARLLADGEPGGLTVRVAAIDMLVRARSCSFVLVREGEHPPDVVKIDVEGAEADAIIGMCATLESHEPSVVCEIHQTLHANEHPVEAALRDAGLELSWLEPGMSRDAVIWAPHLIAGARKASVGGLTIRSPLRCTVIGTRSRIVLDWWQPGRRTC